jgi:hypothetical protein
VRTALHCHVTNPGHVEANPPPRHAPRQRRHSIRGPAPKPRGPSRPGRALSLHLPGGTVLQGCRAGGGVFEHLRPSGGSRFSPGAARQRARPSDAGPDHAQSPPGPPNNSAPAENTGPETAIGTDPPSLSPPFHLPGRAPGQKKFKVQRASNIRHTPPRDPLESPDDGDKPGARCRDNAQRLVTQGYSTAYTTRRHVKVVCKGFVPAHCEIAIRRPRGAASWRPPSPARWGPGPEPIRTRLRCAGGDRPFRHGF